MTRSVALMHIAHSHFLGAQTMASQGDRLEGGKMGLFDDVLGSATGNRSTTSGMSPVTMALLGLLAYRTMQGKGRLADMLGMNKGGAPALSLRQREPPGLRLVRVQAAGWVAY